MDRKTMLNQVIRKLESEKNKLSKKFEKIERKIKNTSIKQEGAQRLNQISKSMKYHSELNQLEEDRSVIKRKNSEVTKRLEDARLELSKI